MKLIIIQDRVGCSWFKCLGLETGQRRKQNPSRSQGDLIVHCTPFARSFTGPEDCFETQSIYKLTKEKISVFLFMSSKETVPSSSCHMTLDHPKPPSPESSPLISKKTFPVLLMFLLTIYSFLT